MTKPQQRQYLEDIPTDIQDMIYDGRKSEVVDLLVKQRGIGKIAAALQAQRIITRMKKELPGLASMESLQAGPGLTAKQQHMVAWAFVSLFCVVGAVFTIIGIHGLVLGFESKSWPSTKGRIIQSRVERRTTGSGSDRRTVHAAIVTYEFMVDNVTYKGDRLASSSAGFGRGSSSYASKISRRYRKGSSVMVYYKPGNPGSCLLEPGVDGKAFVFPVVGVIVLLLGGVFMWAQLSVLRDERKAAEQSPAGDVRKAAPEA